MNGLDFAVMGILLLSMLLGLWRGLLYEVLSLLGWPIAIVLSKLSAGSIAPLLPIAQEEMRIATAYALVFIAALIVWGILARLIARLLKAIGSDWTDRAMGGLFGILVLSMLFGLWRGLINEVLSLLGWPIAFVLSRLSATGIARWLPIEQEEMRVTAAYALVFIAALIVWAIVSRLIAKLLKAIGSDWTDRVMGALFGVLRGMLVVLVLVWMAGLTHVPEQTFWRGSLTGKTLEDVALLTKAWLPDNIAQRIHYRMHR